MSWFGRPGVTQPLLAPLTLLPIGLFLIVSLMELLQGARSKVEARQIRQSLRHLGFQILPLSEPIGVTAATIIERHALAHGIQLADALIAATAIETGHVLCTGNVKHFRPIGSLSRVPFRP